MPKVWDRAPTIAACWAKGRNNFNAMRLFAAWLVIYGHAWAITGSRGSDLVAQLTHYKFAGAVAVDIFFVISGFLISASLERNSVGSYLASRALRILPGLAACTVVTALVLGPWVSTTPGYLHRLEPWRYVALNTSLWKNEFWLPGVFETLPQTAVNGSLWTLPIEARLYLALLVAGIAGVLTPRRYTPLWALAVVGAGAYVWLHRPMPPTLLHAIWCMVFFITGTLLWVNRHRVRLSIPLLSLLLLACAIGRGHPWFQLAYFATLSYATMLVAWVPRLPMIRHTDLSYGLYLYGWPAAQLVQMTSPGAPLHNMVYATLLALALAIASWFLVERPALKLKKSFAVRTPAASASAVEETPGTHAAEAGSP